MRIRREWATGVVIAAIAFGPVGCGEDEPDLAACKAAMKKELEEVTEAIAKGSQPTSSAESQTACKGVDDATLERLGKEVFREASEGK